MSDLNRDLFLPGIIDNLTEGILVTDLSGTVLFANRSAYQILRLPRDGVIGRKFAALFLGDPENDAFCDAVIDAVHADEKLLETIVPFHTGEEIKHLRMYVSFFPEDENTAGGYILVFTDLSELMQLRDIAQDMERVSSLNRQLTMRSELLQKTFGMFVSDEVVRQLLDQPRGPQLGGKKAAVTVMISDLRGFTALSERMDPESLITMLNHYLGEMTQVVQKYGGTIIEFTGDGILAIFGAPVPSESHAADAVAAAVSMQAEMERVNRWNADRGYPELEMGIGLDTGEVIVGNIGSRKRMKYGVVGSHVNLCGRIESYTVGGQILISPEVRAAVLSPLTIEKELAVSPKGVGQDLVLSHVTGIGEPYNVSVRIEKDPPERIPEPVPVSFSLIKGKHTESSSRSGSFTALGQGAAVLRTGSRLEIFDDLRIMAGGPLLCKVWDETKDGDYFVVFTSVPPGYGEWMQEAMHGGVG